MAAAAGEIRIGEPQAHHGWNAENEVVLVPPAGSGYVRCCAGTSFCGADSPEIAPDGNRLLSAPAEVLVLRWCRLVHLWATIVAAGPRWGCPETPPAKSLGKWDYAIAVRRGLVARRTRECLAASTFARFPAESALKHVLKAGGRTPFSSLGLQLLLHFKPAVLPPPRASQ